MPFLQSGGRQGNFAGVDGEGSQDESLARDWLSSGKKQEAVLPCEASGDLEDSK